MTGAGSGGSIDGASAPETLQRVLGVPEVEVLALRFDPLKKVIITAGNNKTIRVRDPALCPRAAAVSTLRRPCDPLMHAR